MLISKKLDQIFLRFVSIVVLIFEKGDMQKKGPDFF